MGLCLTFILIGLTIGFVLFSYSGLLVGLFAALVASGITNQILYKRLSS
ncbi:hypothetical protein [Halalkalibacter akibai]|nr:hypothetical protein [Halalkalibacter akibai]